MHTSYRRALIATLVALAFVGGAVVAPARSATDNRGCGPSRPEWRAPKGKFPNDPLFKRQWNLRQINAPAAWATGAKGRGAVIAVLDTGVDVAHPDLENKIALPRGLKCAWVGDALGHGTHVAGVAAAATNNGRGIAGVAPAAKIMPLGGSGPHRAGQIRQAADNGADVINMSWTSAPLVPVDPLNPDLVEALDYAWKKGVVLVAAAGNDFFPNCEHPASHPRVLCVASTDGSGLPSRLSNFPNKIEGRALRAPGGIGLGGCDTTNDIWGPLSLSSTYGNCGAFPGYEPLGGTSMAAPHVAGVAAMLSGLGLDNKEILDCITSTALNPVTGLRGQFDPVYGFGILDAEAAVTTCR